MYFAMTAHLDLDQPVATVLDRPGLECAEMFLKPHAFTFRAWKIPDSATLSPSPQLGSPAHAGYGFHGNSQSGPAVRHQCSRMNGAKQVKQNSLAGGWGGLGKGPSRQAPIDASCTAFVREKLHHQTGSVQKKTKLASLGSQQTLLEITSLPCDEHLVMHGGVVHPKLILHCVS